MLPAWGIQSRNIKVNKKIAKKVVDIGFDWSKSGHILGCVWVWFWVENRGSRLYCFEPKTARFWGGQLASRMVL